jgi:hypothetical protein
MTDDVDMASPPWASVRVSGWPEPGSSLEATVGLKRSARREESSRFVAPSLNCNDGFIQRGCAQYEYLRRHRGMSDDAREGTKLAVGVGQPVEDERSRGADVETTRDEGGELTIARQVSDGEIAELAAEDELTSPVERSGDRTPCAECGS